MAVYLVSANRIVLIFWSGLLAQGVGTSMLQVPNIVHHLVVFGDNEVKSGEIWKDNTGVHINAHGGGVLFHNGRYYWFGEYKSEDTSAALRGVTTTDRKSVV